MMDVDLVCINLYAEVRETFGRVERYYEKKG
jgi:hypothetical protein